MSGASPDLEVLKIYNKLADSSLPSNGRLNSANLDMYLIRSGIECTVSGNVKKSAAPYVSSSKPSSFAGFPTNPTSEVIIPIFDDALTRPGSGGINI
jgi:hypothetical protein